MPSLRDFEQDHREAKAEENSSRRAKNLRINSAEVRRGARRKPGEFSLGSGFESILPILRVLCALCVLCVELCRDRRIRSSVNTLVENALDL